MALHMHLQTEQCVSPHAWTYRHMCISPRQAKKQASKLLFYSTNYTKTFQQSQFCDKFKIQSIGTTNRYIILN